MSASGQHSARLRTDRAVTDASSPLTPRAPRLVASEDWRLVSATRANVLVEGPQSLTDALLGQLLPLLEGPVYWPDAAVTPALSVKTVVLSHVAKLNASQQAAVYALIGERSLRFVSVSASPLYDLVAQGQFDARLYYLLNTIYLPL